MGAAQWSERQWRNTLRKELSATLRRYTPKVTIATAAKQHGLPSAAAAKFNRMTLMAAATALALGAGTVSASADACSGHGHATGTILGAVGGGAIGSAASHGSLGGVAAGAVLGGLAGNAISRDMDCRHGHRYHSRYYYRHGRRTACW